MDLNELQSVRDRERQTDKLQQLRESFYADAGEFIQQLRAERERAAERADDPFDSPEVNRLTDEINTAKQTVEAIYEKRVGKLVKAASFTAADLPTEADGMTREEQELFDQLVDDIKSSRNRVLDVLDGDTDTSGDTGTAVSESQPQETQPEPTQSASTSISAEETTPDVVGESVGGADDETPAAPESSGTDARLAEASAGGPPADDGVSAADLMGGQSEGDTEPASPTDPGSNAGSGDDASTPADAPPGHEPRTDPPVRNDGGTDGHSVAGTNTDTGGVGAEQSGPASDGTATAESDAQQPTGGIDRQTVRVVDDVETFVGFDDRDYDLAADDVVTLPETNADVLLERGVAQKLE